MNYLKYIELSAENLQFFLWFRSYTKRFDELPENEKALSPEWIEDTDIDTPVRPKQLSPETAAVFAGTDFATGNKTTDAEKNPFFTPPRTPTSSVKREGGESLDSYDASLASGAKSDHAQRATGAFESAGLKWKPRKLNRFTRVLLPMLTTVYSLRPALPRGDHSHHFHLRRRWRQSPAEPVIQRAHYPAACSSKHDSSVGVPACDRYRRVVASVPGSSQLHSMDHLQRQSSSRYLRTWSRYRWDSSRFHRRSSHHPEQRWPRLACPVSHWLHDRHLNADRGLEGNVRRPARYASSPSPSVGTVRFR